MKLRFGLISFICTLVILILASCGGAPPVTIAQLPTFPGATELTPEQSQIAETLAKNMQQNQAINGQLGTNVKLEQKGFSLPSDTGWDKVKTFYSDKLSGSGWSTNSMINSVMEQANQGNDMFQMANWQKDKQNLSVILVADPSNNNAKTLLLSLSSQQ